MKRNLFVLVGCFIFYLYSCSDSGTIETPILTQKMTMPPPSKADKARLSDSAKAYYLRWMSRGNFSGQYLIAKNGHVLFSRAMGYAKFETNESMTMETPIHVASITKVATALTILRLVDKGLIKLDEQVQHYLSKFPYPNITVRMLLNHRSGLPYYGYIADEITDRKTVLTNQDIIALYKKNKIQLNHNPDTHFAYCNTNYAMLALIIEKVTGLSYSVAMKKWLFDPLGMSHSHIVATKDQYDSFSRNYTPEMRWSGFTYLDGIYGDKNLYTTARDLVKLDKATYFGVFLSDSLRKQMYKGYSYERPGTKNYGLGIRLKEKKGKKTFFFHSGWWHGNTGMYCSLRKDTICIIALSNNTNKRVYQLGPLIKACGNYVVNNED